MAGDSTTLPSNVIRHLLVSHSGELWVATSTGVCVYVKRGNCFKRLHFVGMNGEKSYSLEYSSLFEDSKKNIWATTIGAGLMKYNSEGGYFEQMFLPGYGQAKNLMSSVLEDDKGMLWVTSYSHLYQLNPADNSYKEFPNRLPLEVNRTFQSMGVYQCIFDENFLWLGTWVDGIVHFNKQTGEFISYKLVQYGSSNIDNIVFDFHQRENNKEWLATNRGTVEFDVVEKKYGHFIGDSISEKPVANTEGHCIYLDNENIVWFGTRQGLANINPAKQNFVSEPLWINAPVPEFYYDEPTDKIYGIRYYNKRSLIIYERKTGRQNTFSIPHADELRAEPFCVIKDNDGLIWIGTTRGIYTFDETRKKFELLNVEKKLQIPDRLLYGRSVFKDKRGNIWFGCYSKGILMIDVKNRRYKAYFVDEKNKMSFPINAVNRITEGKAKTIYACDDYKGIVKVNTEKETWEYYNSNDNKYAALKGASDMTLDEEDRIWITTRNNGLVCIGTNNEVTTYIKDDFEQLVDEQQSIATDRSGKIWVPANSGIFRFDPVSKSFKKFTHEDGFPVRTLESPLHTLSNGKLSYRFNKGIFAFDPLQILKSDIPLQVHLTSLSVNGIISDIGHSINVLDTLKLNHTENNLTFEYAATNFTNTVSTVYRYMLEGNDKHGHLQREHAQPISRSFLREITLFELRQAKILPKKNCSSGLSLLGGKRLGLNGFWLYQ